MLGGSFLAGIIAQKQGYPHLLKQFFIQTFSDRPPEVFVEENQQPEESVPEPEIDTEIVEQALTIQSWQVSLNGKGISPSVEESSFLALGHIYGKSGDSNQHPASTLIAMVPIINQLHPNMVFSLGDMVPEPTMEYIDQLEEDVFQKLDMPIFNAPGNHDVRNRILYEQRYGPTYYRFQNGPAIFIVLDTEIDPGKITENQKVFLEKAVNQALENSEIKYIFILMHKVLFVPPETLRILFESDVTTAAPNAKDFYFDHEFEPIMEKILIPAAAQKPVYLFAGDVGAWGGNFSPYYQKHPDADLTMMAAGFGDSEFDVAIWVQYSIEDLQISFIRSDGEYIPNYSQYNLDYYLDQIN